MHYDVWRDHPLFPAVHAFHLAGVAKAIGLAHADYKDFDFATALWEFGVELLPTRVPPVTGRVDQMAYISALDPVATEQWYRDRDERDEAQLAEAENDKKMRAIIEAEQLANEANALQVEIDVINEPDPTGDEDLERDWWEIIGRATMAGVTGLST